MSGVAVPRGCGGKRCNSTIRGGLTGKAEVRPSAKFLFPRTSRCRAVLVVQGRNHPAAVTRPPSFFDLSSRLNATKARGNSRTRGFSFSAPFYPIGY